MHRYSTAFSHLVLACTSAYCWKAAYGGSHFPCGTYGIITVNSLLGVWRWGNPDYGHKVDGPYRFTGFMQTVFALPFIATEICLRSSIQQEIAYAHALVACLPFVLYLLDKTRSDLTDTIIGVECLSLGAISFLHENYYGVATAVSYLFNHFYLREGRWNFDDMPVLDVFNYGLCFFCYFAFRALGGKALAG